MDFNKEGYLYFLQSMAQDAIKIGFTENIYQRVKSLQTGNPAQLDLLGFVRATHGAEKALHRHLKPFRIRLEWFEAVEDVEGLINEVLDEAFDQQIFWLAKNHPNSTDPKLIAEAKHKVLLKSSDMVRIIKEFELESL